MLMKISSNDNHDLEGIRTWSTGLSWYDEGGIHPITAHVFYAVPHFEVVDVTLSYDKSFVDLPPRGASFIVAAAIQEYLGTTAELKKTYEEKRKSNKPSSSIDPLFED